jgi:glycine cleavage system H protein
MARTMTYPQGYRYSREHGWVHLQGDTATIGITFHAQQKLGDIVYVDLPKIGTRAEAGKSFGSVESVKAVSRVCAPVSGEVIEINDSLASAPQKLNEDPHGAAWLIRLRVEKSNELNSLLTAAGYESYVAALGDVVTTSGQ